MFVQLQNKMKERGIDAYIIPTSDPHDTEYVCSHFAIREAFSGFTGSAGTLVVLQNSAYCWTDGRYFIQAKKELESSGIRLMKAGLKGTPTIIEFLIEQLEENAMIGYDGKLCSALQSEKYHSRFKAHNIKVNSSLDLIADIWIDRPLLPHTQTFPFPIQYAGKSSKEKVEEVRNILKEKGCSHYVVTKLDEVAWIMNLRAHDIPNFPVAMAYCHIGLDTIDLYIDSSRLDKESLSILEKEGVQIKGYEDIYQECKKWEENTLVDKESINAHLFENIQKPIHSISPILTLKSIKNEIEISNTKKAHLKDGVAQTKFMYWLFHSSRERITEYSAQEKLQEFRKEQKHYIEDSFTTISAYGANAAMMHYQAKEQDEIEIQNKGLYLVDSGAHYLEGTTDTTRTFVMGKLSDQEKHWYTLSLIGHIRLASSIWLEGLKGSQLDILAREPLWKEYMDYQCGTGHGVGHVLSVHEGNNRISTRTSDREAILKPGMITSNEPGVYIEGQFGIRHENEIVVKKAIKNEYGQFLCFETLTFVPFCKEGLDLSLMSDQEIEWLNKYHQEVYQNIHPFLEKEEAVWLKKVCEPIVR